MVDLKAIREARERIGGRLHRTPMLGSATLSTRVGVPISLKMENLQKTGSFKPRGALNNILGLGASRRDRGVITISAGNHAQGVAWAAREVGTSAVVVMPATASASKAEAASGYGAEVVLHGDVKQAFAKLEELRAERDLAYIHAFDDDATIAGQGTVGLEITEDLHDIDTILVGVGGGGLISGVAVAVKSLRPSTRVVGVEPSGAAAMRDSLAAGAPVRLESIDTIADGLAPPFVGERNLEIVRRYVDDMITVDDDEIRQGVRFMLERCKLLAEPAGAAAVAALLTGKAVPQGRTVVIISGGNLSLERLAECLV